MIPLTGSEIAFLQRRAIGLRLLVELQLASGTIRATDHDTDLVVSGQTWTGMGQIASVSGTSFGAGPGFAGLSIVINGAGLGTADDPSGATLLATLYAEPVQLRPVIVRQLVFDMETGELGPVLPFFTGSIARAPLVRAPGGAATLTLELESDDLMLERDAARTRSDADQTRMWPTGGGGFHQVATASAQNGVVWWGQDAPPGTSFAAPPGGGGTVWQNSVAALR